MEKKKLDIMDRVQLRSEDPYPKYYFTKDAGKRKPWYVRAYRATKTAVSGFVSDVKTAIKAILKEVI